MTLEIAQRTWEPPVEQRTDGPVDRPIDPPTQSPAAAPRISPMDARVACVIHDLKAPLTVIKAQAQLLARQVEQLKAPGASPILERLTLIDEVATRMTAALSELLVAGSPSPAEGATADLVALARQVVAEQRSATGRHQIHLEVLGDPAGCVGPWHADAVRRVLENLVGNAVKYSPAGSAVTVTVAQELDADGVWVTLRVRDGGVGIPEADLPRLFEPFFRGRNVGRVPGSGLGLAGARHLVEDAGGRLLADSADGRGSTFTVRLPISLARPTPR